MLQHIVKLLIALMRQSVVALLLPLGASLHPRIAEDCIQVVRVLWLDWMQLLRRGAVQL